MFSLLAEEFRPHEETLVGLVAISRRPETCSVKDNLDWTNSTGVNKWGRLDLNRTMIASAEKRPPSDPSLFGNLDFWWSSTSLISLKKSLIESNEIVKTQQ